MTAKNSYGTLFFMLAMLWSTASLSHPTGNMITVGEHVLWSYIDPVDDSRHHACVMIWTPSQQPRVLIRSEYPASDYMLYHKNGDVYFFERRYVRTSLSTTNYY